MSKTTSMVSVLKASSVLLMVVRFDIRTEPIHENNLFSLIDTRNVGFEVRSTGVLQILQAGPSTMGIVPT